MPLPTATVSDAQRAAALLEAATSLLEVGETGLALAGLERADALQARVPRIKRARAIALAQLERPLDAARALLEELALSPDDGDAFRTFLGMVDRVPQIRALPEGTFVRRLLRRMDEAVERRFAGLGHGATLQRAALYAALVMGHGPAFESAWMALGDDASRDWMLELATLVALGDERVRIPFDQEGLDEFLGLAERQLLRQRDVVPAGASATGEALHLWDLDPVGLPLRVYAGAGALAGWAHLGQFELAREGAHVGPRPGDVAIDAGAGIGDASLWLAHRVGASGRVHAFEPDPSRLALFRQNLQLNPELAGRVDLVAESPARASVDEFVARRGIDRVDFLKLDAGGEEVQALQRAEDSLRRFRPRLAVAVHHRPENLGVVPAHIASLDLGYRVFLGQYAPVAWETVVFAVAD
jgi:hypothetical protein